MRRELIAWVGAGLVSLGCDNNVKTVPFPGDFQGYIDGSKVTSSSKRIEISYGDNVAEIRTINVTSIDKNDLNLGQRMVTNYVDIVEEGGPLDTVREETYPLQLSDEEIAARDGRGSKAHFLSISDVTREGSGITDQDLQNYNNLLTKIVGVKSNK
jgi:hypothetical protein|tara:strand:+ start:32 stop:499 length:468 start_codon:yes stop_codon:yes gene_type:complete